MPKTGKGGWDIASRTGSQRSEIGIAIPLRTAPKDENKKTKTKATENKTKKGAVQCVYNVCIVGYGVQISIL